MMYINLYCAIAFTAAAFIYGVQSLDFSYLKKLGIFCPDLESSYKCKGIKNLLADTKRGCNCDSACTAFGDCCINARRVLKSPKKTAFLKNMKCLPLGGNTNEGAFVIDSCPSNWSGSHQILQKCEGPLDMRDPLYATPVTSKTQWITYRNRYCAECNNANMTNLLTFQQILTFPYALKGLAEEEILASLKYNSSINTWGILRWNSAKNARNFIPCDIAFHIPSYLGNTVRFCFPNIISNCPKEYKLNSVRMACKSYMAVVYDDYQGYKNPHCAICNGKTVNNIRCELENLERETPPPWHFGIAVDINPSDGDLVGKTKVPTPACPPNSIYDPFFKKCKKQRCLMSGYVVVKGKCARP